MNRQFRIHDPQWGESTLFVIHKYKEDEEGLRWQKDWDLFRTDPDLQEIGALFSHITYEAYQDALRGHCQPIIEQLGLPPHACLLKTSEEVLKCGLRDNCSMHDPTKCHGNLEDVPACYEANIKSEDEGHLRALTARIFELWRKGFYIIVVPYTDFNA